VVRRTGAGPTDCSRVAFLVLAALEALLVRRIQSLVAARSRQLTTRPRLEAVAAWEVRPLRVVRTDPVAPQQPAAATTLLVPQLPMTPVTPSHEQYQMIAAQTSCAGTSQSGTAWAPQPGAV